MLCIHAYTYAYIYIYTFICIHIYAWQSNDKDNRYCFADAVLLTLRLDVPPRHRGRPPAPCRNDPGRSDRFRERRLLRPDLTGAKSPTRAHTHTFKEERDALDLGLPCCCGPSKV
jgi:hypothetical protein